ncbi:MAG: hypothetical protein HYX92_15825 [Chloroflexi bacterium]|nr:hypothetical protein [Chloroflexota bacterium]
MMRASAVAEKAGVRTVSVVASGFVRQARAIAQTVGAGNLSVAEYPGVIMTDSKGELRRKVEQVLLTGIIDGLTTPVEDSGRPAEPEARDVVFKGTLEEVQAFFHKNLWTEGLPVTPPTVEAVEKFLRFTDRSPDEVIGVLPPENREATIWNIAVNGVMAGCRPEYMPVLVAATEAMAEPEFGMEHAGATPGWEPLLVLNGPIIKQLDFNYGSGVMRVGRQANTSVGRFLRLYMRNVAGLRIPPGATDKGSIAYTFNVALAENEDAVAELGWQPFSVDRGFQPGENVVTVQSVINVSPPCYTGGHTPLEHMATIAEVIGRGSMAYWTATSAYFGKSYPLFVLSPSVAGVIAKGGWTKDDVRQYLRDNARDEAGFLTRLGWNSGGTSFSFANLVEQGLISEEYCQSADPGRMVPIFLRSEWISIVVSGDPGRNQSRGYMQNQRQGVPTSKKVMLPAAWDRLIEMDVKLGGL